MGLFNQLPAVISVVPRLIPTHAHWHRHRNRYNQCPVIEPAAGQDCKKQYWERDNRLNETLFHGGYLGNRTYRQHLPHNAKASGFQCTYNKTGTLVTTAPHKGTFDYIAPSFTVFAHPKSALFQGFISAVGVVLGAYLARLPYYIGRSATLSQDVVRLPKLLMTIKAWLTLGAVVLSSPFWGHFIIDVLPHLGHNRYETPDPTVTWCSCGKHRT